MKCPLFNDFTRECIDQLEVYPLEITNEILDYCSSDKYKECPFYKMLVVKTNVCPNIKSCPAFEKFAIGGFDNFVEISNKYCVSRNHTKCRRYQIKKKGEVVPICLHPDNICIEEWKEKNN